MNRFKEHWETARWEVKTNRAGYPTIGTDDSIGFFMPSVICEELAQFIVDAVTFYQAAYEQKHKD